MKNYILIVAMLLLYCNIFAQQYPGAYTQLIQESGTLKAGYVKGQKKPHKIWCSYSLGYGEGHEKVFVQDYDTTSGQTIKIKTTVVDIGFELGKNIDDFLSFYTGVGIKAVIYNDDQYGYLPNDDKAYITIPLQFRYMFNPYARLSPYINAGLEWAMPKTLSTIGGGIAILSKKRKKPTTIGVTYSFSNGDFDMGKLNIISAKFTKTF